MFFIFLYLLLWKYQLLLIILLQYLTSQFIILSRTFFIIKYNIFNRFLFYFFPALIKFIFIFTQFLFFTSVYPYLISLYYFILFVCSHIILNSFIFFTILCHRFEATYSSISQRSCFLMLFVLLWLFILLLFFYFWRFV